MKKGLNNSKVTPEKDMKKIRDTLNNFALHADQSGQLEDVDTSKLFDS